MKPIKNYTSDIPINRIFENLQRVLAEHGAKQITFDYAEDGKVYGIYFLVAVNGKALRIKLPAKVENAQAVLKKQWDANMISHKQGREKTYGYEQAYRVAWRNILDWVEAQMALLDIEMAKIEEIFLPYVVNSEGRTLFEFYEQHGFQLPSGGRNRDT